MFDDWMLAVLGLFGFFTAILFYILKTWREIARLEGRIDSMKEDIKLLRGENEGMRDRLKKCEREEQRRNENENRSKS